MSGGNQTELVVALPKPGRGGKVKQFGDWKMNTGRTA
jgi:hypothetical protein